MKTSGPVVVAPTLKATQVTVNDPGYHTLGEQIKGPLTEGRQQSRQAGEAENVETYWFIGDAVAAYIDSNPAPEYGQQIVPNLSKVLRLANINTV